jgi:alpha-galactosidase
MRKIGRLILIALAVGVSSVRAADDAASGPEILTPAAPHTPRINGPNIFGVRPGSPFSYSIPATGDRPMTFSADDLPAGLRIDPKNGVVTGGLERAGKYVVVFHAQNAMGTAAKSFSIIVGDEIQLTPAMGWNSYNCFGTSISQERMLGEAHAFVSTGLAQHGWTYVNMDDGWDGRARGGAFHALQPDPQRFPDVKGMVDTIHALGLKVGLYSTPWEITYGGHLGGSSDNANGDWPADANMKAPKNHLTPPFAIGKFSFSANDAQQFAAWGFDYLKLDWGPVEAPETKEMYLALQATHRDIVLSLSNNHVKNLQPIIADVSPWAESWRTTTDINDNWKRVTDIGFNEDSWAPDARPGHFNDADMLVVGQVGWFGALRPSKLTPDEQYSHISLWCLLSSPLLMGCDLEKADAFTIGLLSNDEVLAVDQDALCKQAVQVAGDANTKVYAKPLEDGSLAVGLFNLSGASASVTAKWADLKISGAQTVRDLWRQKDLGAFDQEFQATVAAHGVVLVRVIPKK